MFQLGIRHPCSARHVVRKTTITLSGRTAWLWKQKAVMGAIAVVYPEMSDCRSGAYARVCYKQVRSRVAY